MPSLPKATLQFFAELLKHQVKEKFGDGALTVLTDALADYAGDTAAEKATAFLDAGQNAEKILSAFRQADECFARQNPNYAQIAASKPLAALERLEKLASRFAAHLESSALLEGIQAQLQSDWGDTFPAAFYPQAARAYRDCLERALAAATGDLLPGIFAKVERTERVATEIKEDTTALREGQEKILDMLQNSQTPPKAEVKDKADASAPNPFRPLSGRITDPARVFDRQRELRDALEYLRAGSSVVFVGDSGTGKSSLLTALAARLPEALGWEVATLDLQPLQDEDDFYAALCETLGVPEARGYRLQRSLQGRRVLLILDEIEKMTWEGFTKNLRAALRGLAEGANAPLKLALAARAPLDRLFPDSEGNTSPLANICIPIALRPWDAETARAYLEERLNGSGIRFTPAETARLLENSAGHPQRLTRMAFDLYARKQEAQT